MPRNPFRGGPQVGSEWTGPRAIFDGAEVGFAHRSYALTPDGKHLLLIGGRPVALTQVDLAPGDPGDGSETYLVAGPGDPPQRAADGSRPKQGGTVAFEMEPVEGRAGVAAAKKTSAAPADPDRVGDRVAADLRGRREGETP